VSGIALAAAGTTVGLRKLDSDRIARAGMLSAAFFVASLIHIPLGPSNVHLILNGIVGLMLGWAAFPTILVALVLQAILFQFGGITTLGVNTVILAVPAVLCHYLFGSAIHKKSFGGAAMAFMAGSLSVFLASVLMAVSLVFTDENFLKASTMVVLVHFPLMVIEGIVAVFCVAFLRKVQPAMLPRCPMANVYSNPASHGSAD
jgi:cobalt/nickel transport system permease protein